VLCGSGSSILGAYLAIGLLWSMEIPCSMMALNNVGFEFILIVEELRR
jgi:hypothetical protein